MNLKFPTAASTCAAKGSYNRKRPFVVKGDTSCTPAEDPTLTKDGSYPSGHAALGWAWAPVLSEVDAGRVLGSAAVAVLHTDPTFTAQLAAAKAEVAAALAP